MITNTPLSVPAQVKRGRTETRSHLAVSDDHHGHFRTSLADSLPADDRMLVTEKIGPICLVSPEGEKIAPLSGTPPVYQGQNGMLGVFVSPHYATDQSIYITYIEPGDYGGGQALARAKLNLGRVPRLENFEVRWRQMPSGKGGQAGGQIAFSPDGRQSRRPDPCDT